MSELATPSKIKEILQQHGISLKHRFGQNFLVDAHYVGKIVTAAGVHPDEVVIEIGPGLGVLTSELAQLARKVIAIEIDRDLVNALETILREYDNVELVNADVLKVDWQQLLAEHGIHQFKVVSNLPYYITTPVLTSLFEQKLPISMAVVMVQKEVADRMVAVPGSKDYGAFSVFIQYYTTPELVTIVPRSVFMPRPKVDSAVVRLEVAKHSLPFTVRDEKVFFAVVKAAFGQRRKMLRKALQSLPYGGWHQDAILACLAEAGIDPSRRGETLSLAEFAALSNSILDYLQKG